MPAKTKGRLEKRRQKTPLFKLAQAAIHEAGHAVAGVVKKRGFFSAHVYPDGTGEVVFLALRKEAPRKRQLEEALVTYAGPCVEALALECWRWGTMDFQSFNEWRDGSESDMQHLTNILARSGVTLNDLVCATTDFIVDRLLDVHVLAGVLLTERRLTATEVKRIIGCL